MSPSHDIPVSTPSRPFISNSTSPHFGERQRESLVLGTVSDVVDVDDSMGVLIIDDSDANLQWSGEWKSAPSANDALARGSWGNTYHATQTIGSDLTLSFNREFSL